MENKIALEEYLNNNNIQIVKITDEDYPEKLKNIYNPPQILYVMGNKKILKEESIAIIGTRMCSTYGKVIAEKLSYDLSKRKFITVSGLARGIDTHAHLGTTKANGRTIAVLGSGIDIIYPKENMILAKEILKKGGAIITEYPIGTKPIGSNFPKRNRIISGLSNGVLVIEANRRSGTFITVDFALEQGREVYVVPGNINSRASEGTNELIKQGAKVVTNVNDITEGYNSRSIFNLKSATVVNI